MSQLLPFLTEEDLPPSPNRRSWTRRIVTVVGIAAIVVGGWWAVGAVRDLLPEESQAPVAGRPVTVVIESGDSLGTVAAKLADAGVVLSSNAFLAAADLDERAVTIPAGVYSLVTGLTGTAALDLMLDPASRAAPLVLPEGLRLADTVRLTSEATGLPAADLDRVLLAPVDLGLPTWSRGRPEGFLFPASYDIIPGRDATAVLAAMVRRFDVAATDIDLVARAAEVGRSPYEILVIASLVQAEAAPRDFAKVAAVIYNRLEQGMPLQLDSTVNYALGTSTLLVTESMIDVDSPYNTYRVTGLPPTPINSPGQDAIEAALAPASGDWLYFVTVDPATLTTRFTSSYEQFLAWKAEFQRRYAEQSSPSPVPAP